MRFDSMSKILSSGSVHDMYTCNENHLTKTLAASNVLVRQNAIGLRLGSDHAHRETATSHASVGSAQLVAVTGVYRYLIAGLSQLNVV